MTRKECEPQLVLSICVDQLASSFSYCGRKSHCNENKIDKAL
jgi:hypothetical protein